MPRLTLTLLGPPESRLDGQPVLFAYDKVQALLMYLAVRVHLAHSCERLAGLFWPERPDAAARTSLEYSSREERAMHH